MPEDTVFTGRPDTLACTGVVFGEVPLFKRKDKPQQKGGELFFPGDYEGREQEFLKRVYALCPGDYGYVLKQYTDQVSRNQKIASGI